MTLRYSQHTYGAANPWTFTPTTAPVAGNLLVITAHTRAAADKLLAVTGWTIVESALSSPTPAVGMSMFYRVAQAGDTAWSIAASQCDVSYSEWSGFGSLLTSASALVAPAGSTTADVNCGGAVTPVSTDPVLIIGSMSGGFENDTATMSSVPDAGVIELDDKGGADTSPGRWSGYIITAAAPSGSYTIGATASVSGAGISQAGITAAFATAVPDPEPGVFFDWDADGFDSLTTGDPDAPLARMLPEAAPAGVSDNVTTRVLSLSWNRGGSYDHKGQDGPGGGTITLRNDDGLFDPDNAAGALYGKLEPGIPVWVGAIRDTGALSGSGTVKGIFGGYVKTWSPTVDATGKRVVEVICEDALGRYRDIPVTVSPSLTRSHSTLRTAILDAIGESSARRSLEGEPGMLPISAVDSSSALSVFEELNQATASRHFVSPGDTKEDWYLYTVVNKYHGLTDAVSETINADDITDVGGWVVTNDNRIEQQRAEVQPVSITPNNAAVWTAEVPITVTNATRKVIWASFDDYTFDATIDSNVTSGAISTTLTNFGKTAKIEIWSTTASATIGTLRVLGRQVVRGDTVGVLAGSTTAGAKAGSTITTDLIGSVGAAQGLVDFIIWKFGNRLKRPSFTIAGKSLTTRRTIADRDLYDVVNLVVDKLSVTSRRLEIIGLSGSIVPGRFYSVTYQTQETPLQAVVDWFTVGTDTVGSAVPIAPF